MEIVRLMSRGEMVGVGVMVCVVFLFLSMSI